MSEFPMTQIFVKQNVSILDFDWLSHVQTRCQILYKLRPEMIALTHLLNVSDELHCLAEA